MDEFGVSRCQSNGIFAGFCSDDLLGRSNPFLSGKASESLTDAIKQASPSILAVAQLAGDADWGAGVTLLQAQIAFRQKDYATAPKDLQIVVPVFTRKDAEAYQKHAVELLAVDLDAKAK